MHRKILSLSSLTAGITLAGLVLSSGSAFAKKAPSPPSPLAGLTAFSALGAGTNTNAACTITGGGKIPGTSTPAPVLYCANGHAQGEPDCPCEEVTGQIKGTQIGVGTFVMDAIVDQTATAGTFLQVPAPTVSLTCNSTTLVGLVQKSGKLPIPIMVFTGGGSTCPPIKAAGVPGQFSGGFIIINQAECPGLPICLFPNLTGGGLINAELEPNSSAPGQLRVIMNGQLHR